MTSLETIKIIGEFEQNKCDKQDQRDTNRKVQAQKALDREEAAVQKVIQSVVYNKLRSQDLNYYHADGSTIPPPSVSESDGVAFMQCIHRKYGDLLGVNKDQKLSAFKTMTQAQPRKGVTARIRD